MKIGISIGDTSGVGIELIIKTFKSKEILSKCTPIVFSNANIINKYKNQLQINLKTTNIQNIQEAKKNNLNILHTDGDTRNIQIGKPCKKSGNYAFKSLEKATKSLQKNEIDILITCPINKYNIQSEKFNFPGHTEYMEKHLKGKSLMFLIGRELRVGVVTGHTPISQVHSIITKELICEKLYLMERSLRQDFGVSKPKIALLSINPHCGDKGIIGNDDDLITIPLIQELQKQGKLFYGPFPADSFFGSKAYKKYDATLAMYHDQGLIPFKTICFNSGVNFTAGLDKIRVSPDHGTAFDIAGKGIVNTNSFKESILTSIEIFKNRRCYLNNKKKV